MSVFERVLDCGTINIFGVAVTTISCILAIIFYLKSRKTKKPSYAMISFNLLKDELKQLKDFDIKYKNIPVKNLTATIFTFWNAGKETIDKSDIPENAQLTIYGSNAAIIYTYEILSIGDISNQVELKDIVSPNGDIGIEITYDYLDQNQKTTIRIMHSGTSNKDLMVLGKIKGAGGFKESDIFDQVNSTMVFILNAFLIGLTILTFTFFKNKTALVFAGMFIGMFAAMTSMILLRKTNYFKPPF